MLYLLLYPLKYYYSFFNIFRYITFRAAYAATFALLICLLLGPWVIKLLRKRALGQNIREEVPRSHITKAGTPSMGGLLIIGAVILTTLLFADLKNLNILVGLFVLLTFGLLGYIDDYYKIRRNNPRGLSIKVKLFYQIIISTFVALVLFCFPANKEIATLTNFPFLKNLVINFKYWFIPWVIFILVISSNAVNFADGLDGLATGLLAIASLGYGILAYISGHSKISGYLNIIYVPSAGELSILCFAVLGACLGFLWFNSYPAQIFMGDTGSLPLGAIIGYTAVVSKHEFLMVFIGGMFLVEILTVIIQIIYFHLTHGKRIFRMAPLHHHFELCGWQEPKITVRFWILGIILAIFAISTLKIR
ncbi:MAG: phospho-N-acetylmuramoyl-pentapeptide-transferase [candidate division WOR-3 bacterium]|nr:phospho-N-acetylmuramoyl-pentapeptide-transferase [candidate division WOR-3 bacterium]MCX7757345.1 phospho-N-acetylmuramoyl-pentapeptide-transferase [candidate division WOR-3 bacterium]MDW7988137.1 phospho-N-acetylmuramoyl-pentapeptide-transferase [candidate division WOR-3 bacterium]